MAQISDDISKMVEQLQSGVLAPGSREGIDAIRQIASISPATVSDSLYMLNNDFLEKGLHAAGYSSEAIDKILKRDEADDPFANMSSQEIAPEDPEEEKSPFEINPSLDIANGPRPRR